MDFLTSLYGLVFLAAAAVYILAYLVPLLRGRAALSADGLTSLVQLLQRDLAEVTAEGRPDADGDSGDDDPPAETPQRWAAERLSRLAAFQRPYKGVVQEAADQIRAQYPGGAYQRFEVERLPTVAAFSERVGAARTMAGAFVLIGLLFTMIRLNEVVKLIATSAGGAQMDPATFLDSMGQMMGGIGGAFDSSIWGLALLVIALVVVAAIDWSAQRQVGRVEAAVAHQVVPALYELQNRLMPDLTLADLLAGTGAHLERLSETVGDLNGELDRSLNALGSRIEGMMTDFGQFTEQYAKLDDLLSHLRESSKAMSTTTALLNAAAKRTNEPLNAFNQTMVRHIETVADWVEVSRTGFTTLQHEIAAVREHTDRLVEGLARAAETGFGEGLSAHRATLSALDGQIVQMQTHLQRVAAEFERAAAPTNGTAPA